MLYVLDQCQSYDYRCHLSQTANKELSDEQAHDISVQLLENAFGDVEKAYIAARKYEIGMRGVINIVYQSLKTNAEEEYVSNVLQTQVSNHDQAVQLMQEYLSNMEKLFPGEKYKEPEDLAKNWQKVLKEYNTFCEKITRMLTKA